MDRPGARFTTAAHYGEDLIPSRRSLPRHISNIGQLAPDEMRRERGRGCQGPSPGRRRLPRVPPSDTRRSWHQASWHHPQQAGQIAARTDVRHDGRRIDPSARRSIHPRRDPIRIARRPVVPPTPFGAPSTPRTASEPPTQERPEIAVSMHSSQRHSSVLPRSCPTS